MKPKLILIDCDRTSLEEKLVKSLFNPGSPEELRDLISQLKPCGQLTSVSTTNQKVKSK